MKMDSKEENKGVESEGEEMFSNCSVTRAGEPKRWLLSRPRQAEEE